MDEQRICLTHFKVAPKLFGTWDQLNRFFLSRFFPTNKVHKKRKEISSFQPEDGETLYDAHERYKMLLKRYLEHNFSMMEITLTFTIGLNMQTCMH